MVTNPALQLKCISKRFRQGDVVVAALSSVSLTVAPGELVAIMGASGSGKSTLLHIVSGLTSPDSGDILVDSADLSTFSDRDLTLFRRRRLGLVFQAFNLIGALTAEENISLPLLADGRSDLVQERLSPLLDRLGLASRKTHRPDALSGGEQQRVAIARALIINPAVVLADEPTGSLDSVSGQSLCRLLRELADEQRQTIVLVTHEPAVAAWADRVVVMKDGCLVTEFSTQGMGSAQALATRYQEIVHG